MLSMRFPKFYRDKTTTYGQVQLVRWLVRGFSAAIICLFLVASILIVVLAVKNDRREFQESRSGVERALHHHETTVARILSDYAIWDDAYHHTSNGIDRDWVDSNFGASLFSTFGIDGVFFVAPSNQTEYSIVEGRSGNRSLRGFVQGDLDELLHRVRASALESAFAQSYFRVGGVPALVTAATIRPDEAIPLPTCLLVFVDVLTPSKLSALGHEFGVEELRFAENGAQVGKYNAIKLHSGVKVPMRWLPERPGSHLLLIVLPILLITALIIGWLAWWLQRRLLSYARVIDSQNARLRYKRNALQQSEQRFRLVAESASDWIWETDTGFELTYLSERFSSITGFAIGDWQGKSICRLIEYDSCQFDAVVQAAAKGERQSLACVLVDYEGRQRQCQLFMRAIEIKGEITGYCGTVCDVTDEVNNRARITYLSQHDELTGLPNRNYLRSHLAARLQASANGGSSLCVIYIDLDRFKPVNDSLGHATGDQVLAEVARRLQDKLKQSDLVARVGGDEFVIVAGGLTNQDRIDRLCRRLQASLERAFVVEGQDLFLSASMGIARAPYDSLLAHELLRFADIALYEAKGAGRSTWLYYDATMNDRIHKRRQIEVDLRRALREGELYLAFQPRYALSNLQVVGAEALVRWRHPTRGDLSPAEFIPIAEEIGLIAAVSDRVLEMACVEAMDWPDSIFVSVNLSPVEFRQGDPVARVAHILQNTGFPAERLELEITENVMLDDADKALTLMHGLKALGVRLAMDDFGTGYSSLGYLRDYPFDSLKIDRCFITDLEQSRNGQAIVEAVVNLGRSLSLDVTAEGVETQHQLDQLRDIACAQAQGYHLGRPMPGTALRMLVNSPPIEAVTKLGIGSNAMLSFSYQG